LKELYNIKMVRKKSKPKGGNGDVSFHGNTAIKKLKPNFLKHKERVSRFKKEIEITKTINQIPEIDNVITILDFKIDATEVSYSMKKYEGDLENLIHLTRDNVQMTANLLLPIIKTLNQLSKLDKPIFHRDLKPSNILYEKIEGKFNLVLADFGCAYLQTDIENRITQEFRSVGPMDYRAPEYHHGKVEQINESGDIFSLGKIIWYLLNGVEYDVFPYTLWFPEEYNLKNRLENKEFVGRINLLIAGMVHHDLSKRITYDTIIKELESIINMENETENDKLDEQLRVYEANLQLQKEEEYNICRNILTSFYEETKKALESLEKIYPDSDTVSKLAAGYKASMKFHTVAENVVNRESDSPVWVYNIPNIQIHARMFPKKSKIGKLEFDYPFIRTSLNINNSNSQLKVINYYWSYSSKTGAILTNEKGESFDCSSRSISLFFKEALGHLTT
jgi:serine/threonine protein kinase